MNRKKLIPLLLFLLFLLLIVCVWCHSGNIVKNKAMSSSQLTSLATNPVVKQDIDFTFVKREDNLELTGNFSTDKSIQILHTAIGTTKFNNLSNINKELEAKEGVVLLTQKLLLDFNENYQNGSISYVNGKLTVEGVVDKATHKNTISTLLASSTIASQNNTRVVIPGPTAEELADIKAQEEADANAKMEAEAKRKAEENAKIEAERKASEQAKMETEAKIAKEKAKAVAFEAKIKDLIDTEHINFETNKDTLTAQSISTIEHIALMLEKHPNVNVEIAGHTDSSGNSEKNLILSQKRVDSVKAKLIELEIDSSRLKAVGYGANKPLVSNDTKENRRINRRVEFKVLGE